MAKDPFSVNLQKEESVKCEKTFIPKNISEKNVKFFSKKW